MEQVISKPVRKRKSRGDDYVNNREFSEAVTEYAANARAIAAEGGDVPMISDYIATCLQKICRGLSRSPNFSGYSFVEEMIGDAVINCLEKVSRFDPSKFTRTGSPNAFGYFTQIAWNAFLRRIAKEDKQTKIKNALINSGTIGTFAEFEDFDGETMIARARQKHDMFFDQSKVLGDSEISTVKNVKKRIRTGPLTEFFES